MAAIEAAVVDVIGGLSGAGLTDAVKGPYQGARSGWDTPSPPSDAAGRSIYDGVNARFSTPSIEGSIRAVSRAAYGSSCAPGSLAKKLCRIRVGSTCRHRNRVQ